MAALVTPFPESGPNWPPKVRQHNEPLLARQIDLRRGAATPESSFPKHFDNTRLVKAPDPVRARQMRAFAAAMTVLLTLVIAYGVQHFWAIEMSYRVEEEKDTLQHLVEQSRQLHLAEDQLTQPGHLDAEARKLGLAAPQPGQIIRQLSHPDASQQPVVAQSAPPRLPAR